MACVELTSATHIPTVHVPAPGVPAGPANTTPLLTGIGWISPAQGSP